MSPETFEDCAVWSGIYKTSVDSLNYDFEGRFGSSEVSARVANHATSGGDISKDIGALNELSAKLIENCGYTERSLAKVHGAINQNVLDSVALYSDVPFKSIPEFGELSMIMIGLSFVGIVGIQKRHEIKNTLKKIKYFIYSKYKL